MKKNLFLVFLIAKISYAQNIGINPNGATPNSSAGLDVNFSDKGLLIPRICLTSSTDITTIPNPATSLLVYCIGSCGLSPAGFYYYDGSQWIFFSVGGMDNLSFPDGLSNLTPITKESLQSIPYTVPAGKNLYITNIQSYCGSPCSNNDSLKINSKPIAVNSQNLSASSQKLSCPLIVGAGGILSSTDDFNFSINGFLVNATVQPITLDNLFASPYTVPVGKTLFIFNIYDKINSDLEIDGITVAYILTGSIRDFHFGIPLVVSAGQQIKTPGSNSCVVNGYLK